MSDDIRTKPTTQAYRDGWDRIFGSKPKPGEPCKHPGCLSHVSHPCEGCGRVAGKPICEGGDCTRPELERACEGCPAKPPAVVSLELEDTVAFRVEDELRVMNAAMGIPRELVEEVAGAVDRHGDCAFDPCGSSDCPTCREARS